MIKLKTAISLFVILGLFSFTSKDAQLKNATLSSKIDTSSELLKKELQANKGHLVLISFWASYDANSRIDNIKFAHLMETFQQEKFSKAKDFAVISVSLDSYKSVYEEIIKRDGLNLVQNIHASNGLNSELAINYKLRNKLGNLLLDAKGEVIAENLTAEELKEILKSSN